MPSDPTRAARPAQVPAAERGIRPGCARAVSVLIWLLGVLVFVALADFATMDALTLAVLGAAVFLPVIVLSIGLLIGAATWALGQETRALQGTLDELRRAMLTRETGAPPTSPAPDTAPPPTLFLSSRARRAASPNPATDQPRLALGPEPRPAPQPLDPDMLIRALDFPEDENDTAGFDALRAALTQPRLAPLIRAAQDVLTRLAQEGIYMEDLRPDRARPEFWRAFAQGARGPQIAPLGGIHDRSCLAITAGRMRSDAGFRASAHLFLREFDQVLADFEPRADDTRLTALADTRTARAFMLLGRVAGVFSR